MSAPDEPSPTTPGAPRRGPKLRELLHARGGVAGASVLAGDLSEHLGGSWPTRKVRDLARSAPGRVVDLGAGFLALTEVAPMAVIDFATRFVARSGGEVSSEALVEEILRVYPHGDARAVRAWLSQDPGRLQHDSGRVRWLGPPRL